MSDDENWAGGAGGAGEEDLSLPKATVAKLINEMLPVNMSCRKDTRDLLIECCTEFVHLLTTQANDISDKEQKKTITGDHILAALEALGFGEYVGEVQEVLKDHQKTLKENQGKSSFKKKLDKSGLTQEELLRQQELLFAQARQQYQADSGMHSGSFEAGEDA